MVATRTPNAVPVRPRDDAEVATEADAAEEIREPNREPRRERGQSDGARAEGRTRDVSEDRTPADLDQSKRRPRRDRASVARNQERRTSARAGAESVEEVAASAATVSDSIEAVAPQEVADAAPVYGSAESAQTLESASMFEAPTYEAPVEEAPRPKPAPAVVVVSPIEAAAEAVKQEPERPAGRAANDPREVRKREREARLRQEGVIGERSPE